MNPLDNNQYSDDLVLPPLDEHDPHIEKEQELLMHIQELQRQLSLIQIEKKEETILEDNTNSKRRNSIVNSKQRLIMVSNRLPISVSRKSNGDWVFNMSSGGLVTALNGIRDDLPFIWIGWFGQEVNEKDKPIIKEKLMKEFSCVPVFLPQKLADEYYNDFSNGILWPTFHYVPLPMLRPGNETKFDFNLWNSYVQANDMFANVIKELYRDGDILWIHDYHLMVLPSKLRKLYPKCTIGWFLHTPFPSSEIYRILPVRKQILEGLLGSDLLGFHTYDYARHFLSACSKCLGVYISSPKEVEYNNHYTSIGVYPIGIDPDNFIKKLEQDLSKKRIVELNEKFKDKKIIVGIDRLDYIKGIPHRLLAVETLLSKYPEWIGKVILIQIAVPSRTDVEEYKQLAAKVNKLVGRINGNYGTLDYSPIHYINRGIPPQELVALYNIADVCLVTSLRDGMNLVSCEYVVCQNKPCNRREGPGVLVLSEFAGSVQSLSGAIRINPWNNDEMANALNYALTLPLNERECRQLKLFRYVSSHSASFWAQSYLVDLLDAFSKSSNITEKLTKLSINDVCDSYKSCKKSLIVLDYDGTLESTHSLPHVAPRADLRYLLEKLCNNEKNMLYIVSSRKRSYLDRWLGDLKIGLAAENGFFIKNPGQKTWSNMTQDFDASWFRVVQPIMQYFTERTPGSYIQSKESSISWHYGDADKQFATMQAREIQLHLEDVLCNLPLEVLVDSTVVEVRPHGLKKAVVIQEALNYLCSPEFYNINNNGEIDFVLCAGDSHIDDDMFSYLKLDRNELDGISEKANIYTCHIGNSNASQASYYVESSQEIRGLLASLIKS